MARIFFLDIVTNFFFRCKNFFFLAQDFFFSFSEGNSCAKKKILRQEKEKKNVLSLYQEKNSWHQK